MAWVVVAAAGAVVALTVTFWQRILSWANDILASWLGDLFGNDLREAFLALLAAGDRFVVIAARALNLLQARIVRARILFRRLAGGREHQKAIEADLRREDGTVVHMEAAEVVPWHELPDEVRERFIRRQAAAVELELKLKQ
mgnify:CR=1 FL=1